MSNKEVSVAEVKSHLSEYLTISYKNGIRIIITKRGKPYAAIVNIDDLHKLEQQDDKKGLAEIAGKWENFEEIAPIIEEIYQNRNKDEHRNVSF